MSGGFSDSDVLVTGPIAWITERHGAQGRDRTADTVIFSHVLYQLSYLGAGGAGRGAYRGGSGALSSPPGSSSSAFGASGTR